jgi:hypothetical protein
MVPRDVPVLPEVQVYHLLMIDAAQLQLLGWLGNKDWQLSNRDVVHHGTRVDSIVNAVLDIGAWLATAHQTFILNIISHQTAIVYDLGQATCVVKIIIEAGGISPETLSESQP